MLWIMIAIVVVMVVQQYWLRGPWFRRAVTGVTAKPEDFLAPVDSYVVYAREIDAGMIYSIKLGVGHYAGVFNEPAYHVGFYMTTLDRHFAVAPCECKVIDIEHWSAGVNLPMLDLLEYTKVMFLHRFDRWLSMHLDGWLTQNERTAITFKVDDCWEFKMILIGDKYVNKIDVYPEIGDTVVGGEVVGHIHRGSQVDIVVPRSAVELLDNANVNYGLRAGDPSIMRKRIQDKKVA